MFISKYLHFRDQLLTQYVYSDRHIIETSNYYNCILHRNCSSLIFFLCVWFAFVWMLTIFTILRQIWQAFLREKKTLATSQASLFFFSRKLAKHIIFAFVWWKISVLAQRQSMHTEKNSGCCNFCGGCNYKFSTHEWDLMCMYKVN